MVDDPSKMLISAPLMPPAPSVCPYTVFNPQLQVAPLVVAGAGSFPPFCVYTASLYPAITILTATAACNWTGTQTAGGNILQIDVQLRQDPFTLIWFWWLHTANNPPGIGYEYRKYTGLDPTGQYDQDPTQCAAPASIFVSFYP